VDSARDDRYNNLNNCDMNKYEMMTLAKGSAGEEDAKKLSKEVKELIASLDGKVIEADFWGKRRLAYKIRHETDGVYEIINFEMSKEKLEKLKAKLYLMNNLVRYLVSAKS